MKKKNYIIYEISIKVLTRWPTGKTSYQVEKNNASA